MGVPETGGGPVGVSVSLVVQLDEKSKNEKLKSKSSKALADCDALRWPLVEDRATLDIAGLIGGILTSNLLIFSSYFLVLSF
jgi:hypothetical protein